MDKDRFRTGVEWAAGTGALVTIGPAFLAMVRDYLPPQPDSLWNFLEVLIAVLAAGGLGTVLDMFRYRKEK